MSNPSGKCARFWLEELQSAEWCGEVGSCRQDRGHIFVQGTPAGFLARAGPCYIGAAGPQARARWSGQRGDSRAETTPPGPPGQVRREWRGGRAARSGWAAGSGRAAIGTAGSGGKVCGRTSRRPCVRSSSARRARFVLRAAAFCSSQSQRARARTAPVAMSTDSDRDSEASGVPPKRRSGRAADVGERGSASGSAAGSGSAARRERPADEGLRPKSAGSKAVGPLPGHTRPQPSRAAEPSRAAGPRPAAKPKRAAGPPKVAGPSIPAPPAPALVACKSKAAPPAKAAGPPAAASTAHRRRSPRGR